MSATTPEEADTFIGSAVSICSQIEEMERKPSSAIPRDVMNCGEAITLLSALVALLAEAHPTLLDNGAADVASLYYRARH